MKEKNSNFRGKSLLKFSQANNDKNTRQQRSMKTKNECQQQHQSRVKTTTTIISTSTFCLQDHTQMGPTVNRMYQKSFSWPKLSHATCLLLLCFSLALVISRPVHCRNPQPVAPPVTSTPIGNPSQQQQPRPSQPLATGRLSSFSTPQQQHQPTGPYNGRLQHNQQHQYQPTVMNTPPSQQQFQAPPSLVSSQHTSYFGRHHPQRVVALHQPVQQQANSYQHNNNNNAYHQRLNHHQHHQPAGVTVSPAPIRHSYQVPSMCHIQEHQKPFSKCLGRDEARLNGTAMAEFRSTLEDTSSELRQLLETHLAEFRALSMGVVLLARNETLNKLQQHQQQSQDQSSPAIWAQAMTMSATKRLFDVLQGHLSSYHQLVSGATSDMFVASSPRPYGSISGGLVGASGGLTTPRPAVESFNQEISNYFKRLHLIQLKRILDSSLLASGGSSSSSNQAGQQHVLDLQCLDKNLPSQAHVEQVLQGLMGSTSQDGSGASFGESTNGVPYHAAMGQHHLEQARLSEALRQSLGFARTLLGSLSLSAEMLNNITRRLDEWMPSQACHAALAQMTVCQECHVSGEHQISPIGSIGMSPLMVAPCENYCLNVARGCMNDLFELNRFWSDHLNALARFRTNMIQTNNIENVMSGLDGKLISFVARLEAQYGTSTNGIVKHSTKNNNSNSYEIQEPTSSAPRVATTTIRLEQSRWSAEVSRIVETLFKFQFFPTVLHHFEEASASVSISSASFSLKPPSCFSHCH